MSDQTSIEWADSTFNPWMGCTKVSPACDHCYAERDTKRFGRVEWGAGKPRVRTSAANWKLPERWNREDFFQCTECGWRGVAADMVARDGHENYCSCWDSDGIEPARRRVFCASLADWLDGETPINWRIDLLDLIARTPNLDWLLLTKRIGNWRRSMENVHNLAAHDRKHEAAALVINWLNGTPPANVWLGSTMIDRPEMLRDAEKLERVPAVVRFWSVEPMLGDFGVIPTHLMPNWIITGGESGPHARPMHPDWVRSLRDQCVAAGVPFLFKQWGEWAPPEVCGQDVPKALALRNGEGAYVFPDDLQQMGRIGKKAAGRQLDGRTHDGFPATKP